MKVINIIKTLFLGSLLYSTTGIRADQEYAKVLFTAPDNPKVVICAHYQIKKNSFKISLYTAQRRNLSNNNLVGYIECVANKNANLASVELLYVDPDLRDKKYGRILSSLAFQEFANQGFKKVTFSPRQVADVEAKTLRQMYSRAGAESEVKDKMQYDISLLTKEKPKPFKNILNDLMLDKHLLRALL